MRNVVAGYKLMLCRGFGPFKGCFNWFTTTCRGRELWVCHEFVMHTWHNTVRHKTM